LPYDSRTPVYELIDQQRRRTPDAVAIRQGSQSLTYAQLAELAERWARVLQAAGLGRTRNERIGVYLERSIEMVASQLAIWKLGAAFVPVDPAQPAERIAHVLRDCAPTAVIADRRLAGVDAIDGLRIFFVDQLGSNEALLAQPIDVSAQALDSAEHLAYVIYTSGSTGAPKGVMVSHRGLLNLITWHRTTFGIEPGWLCSSLAAVGFDATVWEIWPALCAGATVVLAPTHVRGDVGALLSWWSSEPLDVSFLPTPMAEVVFRDNIQHETLRALLVGGDTLRQVANAPSYRLFNNYGPTECTVVATSGRIDPSCEKFHIGRPIANSQAYILDRQRRPVPIDVIGELYMGGDGIAMGYLDRPELTAERFLNDPFVGDPTARLYRTGDLARWRADGTIEYVGRNDQQIKIRGNRVELGEIEAHLLSFAAVQEAAVLAREDVSGEKIVVAYVVARHPSEFSAADLRDKMKQALPAYMVPATFVVLDNLPLSANGKLDRAALAKQTVSAVAERACVAATTDTQRVLCDLWSQVLPVKVLGVEDNFFEVGGHSINAMTLVARISEHFDIDLAVTALFRNPTVRQLEVFLQGRQAANQASAALAGFQEGIL
ncbi:MAG: non-ribosomal peptide synthetase, partial [Pseudomonadota bacterium]|nr:non-ribosomal peptide synthetase [Pseudomonadota bacterium]